MLRWLPCFDYATLACHCLQGDNCGPWAAYVDNPAEFKTHLKRLFPSLQHVIADITHVMRRFSETLTPHHPLIGEAGFTAAHVIFKLHTCGLKYHLVKVTALPDSVDAIVTTARYIAGAFMRALSAAIFVRDKDDEQAVKRFHAAGGRGTLTPEQLAEKDDKYYDLRCRRLVNAKEVLLQKIPQVIDQFAGTAGFDPAAGYVVTEVTKQVWQSVKELIESDSFCGEYMQGGRPSRNMLLRQLKMTIYHSGLLHDTPVA